MFDDLKPHIADLRKRLMISIGSLIAMFFVCFFFYEPILEWMMVPVEAVLPPNSQMVAVEIQETFFTALKVAFFAGFILSLPVIFWQLWLFLAASLFVTFSSVFSLITSVFCVTSFTSDIFSFFFFFPHVLLYINVF